MHTHFHTKASSLILIMLSLEYMHSKFNPRRLRLVAFAGRDYFGTFFAHKRINLCKSHNSPRSGPKKVSTQNCTVTGHRSTKNPHTRIGWESGNNFSNHVRGTLCKSFGVKFVRRPAEERYNLAESNHFGHLMASPV